MPPEAPRTAVHDSQPGIMLVMLAFLEIQEYGGGRLRGNQLALTMMNRLLEYLFCRNDKSWSVNQERQN